MARILVIEDEPDIQQILDYNLREKGHKVFLAGKGEEGLRLAREKRPDLVLLDLMLPDIPGTEVCKVLKSDAATKNAQVVMLTAKGEEIDRVVGFELGADDYVVKPFSVRELLLRVQAILRRSQAETEFAGSTTPCGPSPMLRGACTKAISPCARASHANKTWASSGPRSISSPGACRRRSASCAPSATSSVTS